MERTRLSTKGQVILPKNIRRARRWKPGLELTVEDTGEGVLLRPAKPYVETSLEDLRGCVRYKGRRVTLTAMERAIATGAKSRG